MTLQFAEEMQQAGVEALGYFERDWLWHAAGTADIYTAICGITPLRPADALPVSAPALEACRALAMLIDVESDEDRQINARLAKMAERQLKLSKKGAANHGKKRKS